MQQMLSLYFFTTIAFFAIDMVWLGVVAKDFYRAQIGHLMTTQINWVAAIIFYLIFLMGLLYFAVYPAIQENSLVKAVMLGALFGFFTYATYDLTNYATLRDWPLLVTVVDMAWGTALGATVAGISFWISRFIY
ncbi:DUF2177 family protein [bacterium]|nr:DUF2177 family protein [bacterium]